MDIYISTDPSVEPSDFQNDMEVKKQSRFILRSASLPAFKTFVMAIRVNGANLYENAYFQSQVYANFKTTQNVAKGGSVFESLKQKIS
jgi:hypothetical protein